MGLMEELKALGVNTDEAIARMNHNVSLYERMLIKFLDMLKSSADRLNFENNSIPDIIEAAHAIKGTSGNLSVTPIYEAYSEIVRLLREDQPEQVNAILTNIIPLQTEIMNCIEKYS